MSQTVRELADFILGLQADPATTVDMFWGQVQSIQSGPASLTIRIGASTVDIPGVRYSASYTPTRFDTVYGRKMGTDYLVEGTIAQ